MGTQLFGVITGLDLQVVTQQKSFIDGIEIRLDYFPAINHQELKAFISQCNLPVMLTLRRKDQGGRFSGTEDERLKQIESLCQLGPDYIDLEYDVPENY